MAEAETQLTDQQLEEKLNEQTAQKDLEFKTETGQVFKGKSWEEIAQKMAQSVESGSKTIKEQRDREAYLLQQIQERQNQQVDTKVPKTGKEFDKLRHYELWQNDPLEAYREPFQRLLADTFGMDDVDEVRQALNFTYNATKNMYQSGQIVQFQGSHPEYNGGEDHSSKLTKWLLDNGYEMDPGKGKFISAKDLEYGWYKLIEAGDVEIPDEQEQQAEARRPAPTLSGAGGGATGSIDDKVSKMSDKELENFLRQSGMLKY